MIIQGSNNVQLSVYIIEKGIPSPLNGATVTVTIKAGTREMEKPSTVIGTGEVSVLLTSDDLSTAGTYYVQASVSYTDGRLFISEEGSFIVGAKL